MTRQRDPAGPWAQAVVSGKIVANETVWAAAKRHLRLSGGWLFPLSACPFRMPLLVRSDSITAANTGSEYANNFEYLKVKVRMSG